MKRVPVTETTTRIHTSTVRVAVMPQPIADEVHINESDVRFDVFRASGPDGQKVNSTDSAIRLTHWPTGIVIAIQNERSIQENRDNAFTILRAWLFERERLDSKRKHFGRRLLHVRYGVRSRKARTYHFPMVRVPFPDPWHHESCLHAVLRDFPYHSLANKNRPHGPHVAIIESGDRPQEQQDALWTGGSSGRRILTRFHSGTQNRRYVVPSKIRTCSIHR